MEKFTQTYQDLIKRIRKEGTGSQGDSVETANNEVIAKVVETELQRLENEIRSIHKEE